MTPSPLLQCGHHIWNLSWEGGGPQYLYGLVYHGGGSWRVTTAALSAEDGPMFIMNVGVSKQGGPFFALCMQPTFGLLLVICLGAGSQIFGLERAKKIRVFCSATGQLQKIFRQNIE